MAATADAEGAATSGGRGRLRVAFAGTPEFARVALRDLLAPGKGSNARMRRAMAVAGIDQSMVLSTFSILCA